MPLHALDLVLQGHGLHRNQIHGPGLWGAEMAGDQMHGSSAGGRARSSKPGEGQRGDCSHLPFPGAVAVRDAAALSRSPGNGPQAAPLAQCLLGLALVLLRSGWRLMGCRSRKCCRTDPDIRMACFYFGFGPRTCFIAKQDRIWGRIAPAVPRWELHQRRFWLSPDKPHVTKQ